MARFDVYVNPNPASARRYPFLVEVQSDLLSELATTVVIPLAAPELIEARPISRLNPEVSVEGYTLLAMTQELAAISRRPLTHPLANLAHARDALQGALDLLFIGF
jgi:toxin CcdB